MRKSRLLREGARYHVSCRSNRREMILESDSIKDMFLSVLKEAKRKYCFQIENICIMGNHVHLIIRPGVGESLSSIMQWALGVFAMRFNRHFGLTGHVWGERFFSRILEDMRAYLETFVYIDENPLEAGLVASVEDWRYGRFHLAAIGCEGLLANLVPGDGWS